MKTTAIGTLLAGVVLLLAGSGTASAQMVGHSYLRMHLNGTPHLDLSMADGMHQMTPVVAYITIGDRAGPGGAVMPANTLSITGRAQIDMTLGASRTLTISLLDIDGPGTYDILEHGGVVVYSDASNGVANFERVMGWNAGVDEEGSSGSVTITEVGNAVPGMGWPVKGHFTIDVVGGPMFRRDYNKKRDQQKALIKGEFSWGL